jgi:DNA-binding response OmpR family regulator
MAEAEILVVDDEPAIGRLLQEFLTTLGFGVRVASSGQAALAAIDQSPPDAVLLDLYMPTLDGVEVLRRLRQRWPTSWPFAVIILTGSRDEPLLEAALALGAFDVLPKPINLDQLELALRAHLARRPPKSSTS